MGEIVLHILDSLPALKEPTPRLILGLVRANESISRVDLARETGLHPSTITRTVASLMEEGLLKEDGEGYNELGRKPILLSLVPDAIHVIGLAIESTFISGVLSNLAADIIEKREVPLTQVDTGAVQEQVESIIDDLLAAARIRNIDVKGIGVAMHGIIDSANGVCLVAPAAGWRNFPIASIISARYQLPVSVGNNANSMALGESWFGNGKGVENLVAVKVGQHIGSGILLNGQLFPGPDFGAGEIGHLTVISDGPACKCGNYGCLETVASIGAVIDKARVMLKRGERSSLLALIDNDPYNLRFEHLCEAAACGDRLALQLWEEAGSYLGLALANTINILNPTKILIGGDVYPAVDFIIPKAREIVAARALESLKTHISIEPVGLGEDAVTIGAVTLMLKEIFSV